jgi:hypothetical protein
MPHFILEGTVDFGRLASSFSGEAQRWGPAVLKTEGAWRRADDRAVLVEGVVVEHSRPLHPVAVVTESRGETSVRLWRLAPVERTPAVQRWLASVASEACRHGAGPLKATNVADDLWQDFDLKTD